MRLLGSLFLWFLLLASLALFSRGVEGIYGERGETPSFTPYVLLFLSMVVMTLFAWQRGRHRSGYLADPSPGLFPPTIRHRSRCVGLAWLLLWWLGITAPLVYFHVGLDQSPEMLSLGVLSVHLILGLVIASFRQRSARQAHFFDDPTLALNEECHVGEQFQATVAQALRRPVQLEKWEIALICEETRQGLLFRSVFVIHEDRRVVAAERVVHRGEILHGGGLFALGEDARPSSGTRVVWHLESVLTLGGIGTFESRFPIVVHSRINPEARFPRATPSVD